MKQPRSAAAAAADDAVQQRDAIAESLASLGDYRCYYQDLPPQIRYHHSPTATTFHNNSSRRNSATTSTTPKSTSSNTSSSSSNSNSSMTMRTPQQSSPRRKNRHQNNNGKKQFVSSSSPTTTVATTASTFASSSSSSAAAKIATLPPPPLANRSSVVAPSTTVRRRPSKKEVSAAAAADHPNTTLRRMIRQLQKELAQARRHELLQLQKLLLLSSQKTRRETTTTHSVSLLDDSLSSTSSTLAVFGENVSLSELHNDNDNDEQIWSSEYVRSFVSTKTDEPPVPKVVILRVQHNHHNPAANDDSSIRTRLAETEQRATTLEERLQASDAMANMLFSSLKDVRRSHDELERLLNTTNSHAMGSSCCDNDLDLIMLSHSLLMRVALLASLVALYHGSVECFAATIAFLFVSLLVHERRTLRHLEPN